MTSKLGVYWSVMHRREQDYAFFMQLNPAVMKVMDGGDNDYEWIRRNLPNSLVVARIHALSEQHDDMLRDPIGTGQRHAQEWDAHQRRLGFDRNRTLILGQNEPRVWESGVPEALRLYTIAMCDKATELGLRVGAMQLSVGWPGNRGPDMPPDWSPWNGVEAAIRRNNGALVLHDYWADQGPSEMWGWWAGRSLKCPWNVPIVIGECGSDQFVKDSSVEHARRGFNGRIEPERYAAELVEYANRMSADPRFVGCAVFAADFASGEWWSFDLEPAYGAIVARLGQLQTAPTRPAPTVHMPVVLGAGPSAPPAAPVDVQPLSAQLKTMFVSNLRSSPYMGANILAVVDVGAYFEAVGQTDEWYQVNRADGAGVAYLHKTVALKVSAPTPSPAAPSNEQEAFERTMAFVLKEEGGLSTDPNDPGNYVNGRFVGTKYGISANAHPDVDILNLSVEQAKTIYRNSYWISSSASALPWPLCLAVMDLAVNGGVGRAKEALNATGHDFVKYMAWRIRWYTTIPNFDRYGPAWIRRCSRLMDESVK